MVPTSIHAPLSVLTGSPIAPLLKSLDEWWRNEGQPISDTVDRAGTPWLKTFDSNGQRIDHVQYVSGYEQMLRKGYEAGVVWRPFAEGSLQTSYELGYLTAFYDPGLYCPYIVTLATALTLDKYGEPAVKDRFLPHLLRRDGTNWQGATWITEMKGGSDLGGATETLARKDGPRWRLTGDKYFCSNATADCAVVAARPERAPEGIKGVALFFVPRRRSDGNLNFTLRRLKNKIGTRSVPTGEVELRESEAYLLGSPPYPLVPLLDVLNLSRAANAVASVALMQRAISDAISYATQRHAFGRAVIEQPLMRRQFTEQSATWEACSALAWECVRLLDACSRELPPYTDRYHLLRLVTHLAKYWTAECAVQTSKWTIEVYGGIGTLEEFGVERWLRETMICQIWEGTPHRHILDGLEVMVRQGAHRLLFKHVGTSPSELAHRIEQLLALPTEEQEANAETVFRDLAAWTAKTLRNRRSPQLQSSQTSHG